MGTKTQYWGLILDPRTHAYLVQKFADFIPKEWRVFCHHMTITHAADKRPDLEKLSDLMLGENHAMVIHAIGRSDKAVALRVVTDIHSAKKITHITLAVAPGAKPVDSNEIDYWKRVPYETVFGCVCAVPSNNETKA